MTVVEQRPAASAVPGNQRWRRIARTYGALAVLVVVVGATWATMPGFGTPDNLIAIVTAACFIGLITIGQSFVLISGGIDLSVGSIVGLATVLAALTEPAAGALAFAVPVLAGLAIGLINGLLIGRGGMAPFIVTLAALLGVKGLAVALADSSIVIGAGAFTRVANGSVLGVPNLAWFLLLAFGIAALVLNRTSFGSRVFAVGGNEEAARMMGVNVARVKVAAYALSGALAGLAGALLASRLSSGVASLGSMYELKTIAAAVIGGVLLTGGVGTMLGALCGVLLISTIDSIINQIGSLNAYFQDLFTGIFLVVAMVIQSTLTRGRAG